jgi:hypothetical protein
VSNKTDPHVPPSPRTLYETEKEKAQARFEVEATYEACGPNPVPPSTTKERTALTIMNWYGLMTETVETGSLNDFKRVAQEFVASAL